MEDLTGTYKGTEWFYDEDTDKFCAGESLETDSLFKLKRKIDNRLKTTNSIKFKGVKVYTREDYWNDDKFVLGHITSYNPVTEETFITFEESKKRNKKSKYDSMYSDTEGNRQRIKEMARLEQIVKDVEAKVSDLKEELERFNPETYNAG